MNIGGGETDTLKFNLHIIRHAKKVCEFNQKKVWIKKFPLLNLGMKCWNLAFNAQSSRGIIVDVHRQEQWKYM
jgi:hypothetical protein